MFLLFIAPCFSYIYTVCACSLTRNRNWMVNKSRYMIASNHTHTHAPHTAAMSLYVHKQISYAMRPVTDASWIHSKVASAACESSELSWAYDRACMCSHGTKHTKQSLGNVCTWNENKIYSNLRPNGLSICGALSTPHALIQTHPYTNIQRMYRVLCIISSSIRYEQNMYMYHTSLCVLCS